MASNILDGDLNTAWQADRVLWKSEGAFIIVDMKEVVALSRIVWVNYFPNSSPSKYSIDFSYDGKKWTDQTLYVQAVRKEGGVLNELVFPTIKTRYFRFNVLETLSEDSALISEMWPVKTEFSAIKVAQAEQFIEDPFTEIPDYKSYILSLSGVSYRGKVDVSRNTDGKILGIKQVSLVYSGKKEKVRFISYSGGKEIIGLHISNFQLPGDILITSISSREVPVYNWYR